MGYLERSLIPGETILYRTRHHWVAVVGTVLAGTTLELAGLAALLDAALARSPVLPRDAAVVLTLVLLLGGSLSIVWAVVKLNATEMAVTNKRVMVKTGITTRKTFEMLLSRIESIGVEEPFLGRMLGYGTVILRGVGGTPDEFDRIANPLEFRSHVQEQIEATARVS